MNLKSPSTFTFVLPAVIAGVIPLIESGTVAVREVELGILETLGNSHSEAKKNDVVAAKDPYSSDSSINADAIHDGVISKEGGRVTVERNSRVVYQP
ncbi:hypothetical protein PM082_006724 [Marasmius tenuissimus]|nr:hypothetical protein PM082_006724 [Marasmius tenuissimus]